MKKMIIHKARSLGGTTMIREKIERENRELAHSTASPLVDALMAAQKAEQALDERKRAAYWAEYAKERKRKSCSEK